MAIGAAGDMQRKSGQGQILQAILSTYPYFYGHKFQLMSQAFVKESDGEWLHDVTPSLAALTHYLTKENNGVRVYEKSNRFDESLKRQVHLMSNGLNYAKDDKGTWYIVE